MDLCERSKVEFSNERFTKHLTGYEKPILKPLVELHMKERLEAISHQFVVPDTFMKERAQPDTMVQEYIQRQKREKLEQIPSSSYYPLLDSWNNSNYSMD